MPLSILPLLLDKNIETKSGAVEKTVDVKNIELIYKWLRDFIDEFTVNVEEIIDGSVSSGFGNSVNSIKGIDHLHGITSLHADGSSAIIELIDIAEYIELVTVDGVEIYPGFYTLSNGKTSILLDSLPTAGQFITVHYIIARL